MSWIQENRFAAGLGGITVVAAAALIFVGMKAGSTYSKAQEEYNSAADEVESMAKEKPYPNDSNLQGKKKAVEEYETNVDDLQKAFGKFRSPTPPNVDPAEFSEALLKAKEKAATAFAGVRPTAVEVPAEFFLGFEAYTTAPVKKEATGILSYELEAIGELAANLAAAAPSKLINIHRPLLPEEEGKPFDAKGKSFRALPVEISFSGTEDSLRKFLSSLDDSGKFYFVVRSMRVMNEKIKAPTAADGAFKVDDAASEKPPAAGGADPFGGAFVLPGDEPPAGDKPADAPADAPPADAPADAPAAGDEGVILQQVLGSEKINTFLRIDILQFLEAPKA